MIRSRTVEELEHLRAKVQRCFDAGAVATGTRWEIVGGKKPYAHIRHDDQMVGFYRRNAEALSRKFPDPTQQRESFSASTDMRNVSMAMRCAHPLIGIESLPTVNHQPEFAAHCVTPAADRALRDGAVAMAWTAIDLAIAS